MSVSQMMSNGVCSIMSAANYYSITSALPISYAYGMGYVSHTTNDDKRQWHIGKYPSMEIANWFLNKSDMTHKKLQKLCYYAQAWYFTLYNQKLMDCDFQAWVHGPVSPYLYEQFKKFSYNTIRLKGKYKSKLSDIDDKFLSDVWETYGEMTANALEMLSHREKPWREARLGYRSNEKCTVKIEPKVMKEYYRSIYIGK